MTRCTVNRNSLRTPCVTFYVNNVFWAELVFGRNSIEIPVHHAVFVRFLPFTSYTKSEEFNCLDMNEYTESVNVCGWLYTICTIGWSKGENFPTVWFTCHWNGFLKIWHPELAQDCWSIDLRITLSLFYYSTNTIYE